MRKIMPVIRGLTAMSCIALASCAAQQPVRYGGIASASSLTPNQQDDADRIPYRYATAVDWKRYNRVIVDPVAVYGGTDNQFGSMSAADKAELARDMQLQLAAKLQSRFTLVNDPGPNTLRLVTTLTGANENTAFLSPFSHIDMAGNIYNVVQTMRGGQGLLSGSVFYSVEIYDAPSNRLLDAYIARQYPNAMNVTASFGSLSAAKTGIEKGVDALVDHLQ